MPQQELSTGQRNATLPHSRPCFMFVIGMQPVKIGGIEKFLRYLVDDLDKAGWDSVLCFDGAASEIFRNYFSQPYVTLERLDDQGNLGVPCIGPLWKLLRTHKPRVFAYAFNSAMRTFPWLAKLAGCKGIYFNDHTSRPFGARTGPLKLSSRIVGRILTFPLTSIISVADFTRRSGTALGITSAPNIVVSNGVELLPGDVRRRSSFRQRFGISEQAVVVTQVCWMVEVKGVETMLAAASRLLQKYPDTRFLLVGTGSELEKYRQMAADLHIEHAVLFPGMINDPVGSGVFDAADIYCQPSKWQEACPLAVLEAMSFALPVIASDTGGLPELVEGEKTGILIPVGDSTALYTSLVRLIEDRDFARSLGKAGYDSIVAEHNIEAVSHRYTEILTAT